MFDSRVPSAEAVMRTARNAAFARSIGPAVIARAVRQGQDAAVIAAGLGLTQTLDALVDEWRRTGHHAYIRAVADTLRCRDSGILRRTEMRGYADDQYDDQYGVSTEVPGGLVSLHWPSDSVTPQEIEFVWNSPRSWPHTGWTYRIVAAESRLVYESGQIGEATHPVPQDLYRAATDLYEGRRDDPGRDVPGLWAQTSAYDELPRYSLAEAAEIKADWPVGTAAGQFKPRCADRMADS
ncbi:hypothetical protein ACMXN5_49885 (plasmid) [Embleya sp. MST-111070]